MTTIRPHELTPEHVNKRVRVTRGPTVIEGRLGPYQHDLNWVGTRALCDVDDEFELGSIGTDFHVGPVELTASQHDPRNFTIEILEEDA